MDPEDICIWANGTWCYAEDLWEYRHMSDDYERVPFDSQRWQDIVAAHAY